MADRRPYLYDVFISHSPADREWVDSWLLPRLHAADIRTLTEDELPAGVPRVSALADAVDETYRTIAIITPDWLRSEWNQYETLLTQTADPAARRRKFIPVVLRPTEVPDRISGLTKRDLTAEKRWEDQTKLLVRDLWDVIPPPPPPLPRPGGPDVAEIIQGWRWWLRYHRWWARTAAVALFVAWVLLFTALRWSPFQDRLVWLAEPLDVPGASVLHNTGTTLFVGGENVKAGCNQPHKGLWFRRLEPGSPWRDSDVGDLLCIETWNPPSLSNIIAVTSLPDAPQAVYVLTSHSGILVSNDGGAHFSAYPVPIPPAEPDNWPTLLVIGAESPPTFWVAGLKRGLLVYRGGQWTRLDGTGPAACAGLPSALTVKSLVVTGDLVLIGSDQQGLWLSEDGGHQCRQVFDEAGRYEFRELWDTRQGSQPPRYLALVRDWHRELGATDDLWQLLDICPRAGACGVDRWQSETIPVGRITVEDLLIQRNAAGSTEWYLVTALGGVRQGTLTGEPSRSLPCLTRCLIACEAAFAPVEPGAVPYLLAADHIYHYTEGAWWRRLWP